MISTSTLLKVVQTEPAYTAAAAIILILLIFLRVRTKQANSKGDEVFKSIAFCAAVFMGIFSYFVLSLGQSLTDGSGSSSNFKSVGLSIAGANYSVSPPDDLSTATASERQWHELLTNWRVKAERLRIPDVWHADVVSSVEFKVNNVGEIVARYGVPLLTLPSVWLPLPILLFDKDGKQTAASKGFISSSSIGGRLLRVEFATDDLMYLFGEIRTQNGDIFCAARLSSKGDLSPIFRKQSTDDCNADFHLLADGIVARISNKTEGRANRAKVSFLKDEKLSNVDILIDPPPTTLGELPVPATWDIAALGDSVFLLTGTQLIQVNADGTVTKNTLLEIIPEFRQLKQVSYIYDGDMSGTAFDGTKPMRLFGSRQGELLLFLQEWEFAAVRGEQQPHGCRIAVLNSLSKFGRFLPNAAGNSLPDARATAQYLKNGSIIFNSDYLDSVPWKLLKDGSRDKAFDVVIERLNTRMARDGVKLRGLFELPTEKNLAVGVKPSESTISLGGEKISYSGATDYYLEIL